MQDLPSPGFIRFPELAAVVLFNGQKVKIEMKCSTCAYGGFPEDCRECSACFKQYTVEKPYSQWVFDCEYDPEVDVF